MANRTFLTLLLAILLVACGRAPETPQTVAEPAGTPVPENTGEILATGESAGDKSGPEPTAAPA
jgi:hypothetical protein